MEIVQAFEGIKQHFEAFAASAAEKLGQEMPVVQQLAQQASANPAVVALLSAVHLGGAPEVLAELATTIVRIDEALGAAKAQQPPADPAAPAA